MPTFAWAILIKPFVLLVMLAPGVYLRFYFQRRMPEGRWKRLLLRKIS
jgi:hypothetical protein